MHPIIKRNLAVVLFIIFIVCVDQWTKTLILKQFLIMQSPITITPFFDLILVWNYGVSFGMFNTPSQWNAYIFTVFSLSVTAFLLIWLWRTQNILLRSGLSLIAAGAIGNVLDRLRFSAVVDFLHFHWGPYAFPTFNIADAAITLGVGFILLDSVKSSKGVIHEKEL